MSSQEPRESADRGLPGLTEVTAHCEACGGETPHTVTIEVASMSDEASNKYSRQPRRTITCMDCETESIEWLNRTGG